MHTKPPCHSHWIPFGLLFSISQLLNWLCFKVCLGDLSNSNSPKWRTQRNSSHSSNKLCHEICWVVPTIRTWIFYYIAAQEVIFSIRHLREYSSQLPAQRSIFVRYSTSFVIILHSKPELHCNVYFYIGILNRVSRQYCCKIAYLLLCTSTGIFCHPTKQ